MPLPQCGSKGRRKVEMDRSGTAASLAFVMAIAEVTVQESREEARSWSAVTEVGLEEWPVAREMGFRWSDSLDALEWASPIPRVFRSKLKR